MCYAIFEGDRSIKKDKLIIITELFYPDTSATAVIMSKIAEELNKNFEIEIICGPEPQNSDRNYYEKIGFSGQKFKINRVSGTHLNKNNLVKRVFKQLGISINLGVAMIKSIDRNTQILTVTNPPSLPFILALGTLYKTHAGTWLLVHDLFPYNAFAMGMISEGSMLGRCLKKLVNWAYKKLDNVIVIGRDMQQFVENENLGIKNKTSYISNWSDPSLRTSTYPKPNISSDKITFGYAGNIGRAQGILKFSSIVKSLDNEEVDFLFSGTGALSERLKGDLKGLDNSRFDTDFFRHEQDEHYNQVDVAIVLLGEGMFGLGVPSKTYNLIAAGLPILFVGPRGSEIYCLVVEEGIGWAFDWDEKEELIAFFNSISIKDRDSFRILSQKCNLVAERYKESEVLKKYTTLFEHKNINQS